LPPTVGATNGKRMLSQSDIKDLSANITLKQHNGLSRYKYQSESKTMGVRPDIIHS